GKPDSGIWEYRATFRPQTFSSLMCWAAADRTARISERHESGVAAEFRGHADRIRREILQNAMDPRRGALVAVHGGKDTDAALLQAVTLRLLPADDPRMQATIDAIREDLEYDGWLRRYMTQDDFGVPSVAFVICTFWLIEALATVGRTEEARSLTAR